MTADSGPARFDGFLRAGDGGLLDGGGREVLLRGVGLGNWLLPEAHMWRLPHEIDSPRRIEALVERLVGPARATAFWHRSCEVFVTEADIARIAAEGCLERCTYRPEVVNAVLRRAPLTLPATGFSFRGPGRSYGTTGDARPLAGYRPDDAVTVTHAGGDVPLAWHHTDGRPRAADETFSVELQAGDWLHHDVEVPRTGELRVEVAAAPLAGTPNGSLATVTVGEERGELRPVPELGVWSVVFASVPAGRHGLRFEARAALSLRSRGVG